jgi:hypothetical protein
MSSLIRLTLTAAAVVTLASCGGSAEPPPQASTGWVVDGYLSGATVICDANGNGVADTGELTVRTDGGGRFSFAAPGCGHALVAVGGTDIDTGRAFRGVFTAPAGATVVTPLTTLMSSGMASNRVIATLGLASGTDITRTDPTLNPALMKPTLAVAQLLIKTTETLAALGGATSDEDLRAIYREVAAAYAVLLQGGGTLLAGSELDQTLTANLVKAATQRVAQASGVPAAVRTALTPLNADALGLVMAGGLKVQVQHITQAENAALVAAATAAQNDNLIADFVFANRAALNAAPTNATAVLAAALTEEVRAGLTTVPAAPATLPISFDGPTPVIFLGFNGAEGSTIEAGPAGGDGKALRILRLGGDPWAGAFITTEPLPLAADRKTITARVHSPAAGVRMVLKLEGEDGLTSAEFTALEPVVAGWQTLTWVANGIDLSKSYTRITLLPNLGTIDAAPGQSYFFDDIALVNDSATPPPPAGAAALPINFDDVVPTDIGQFGAGAAVTVAPGPEGGQGNAVRFTKTAGDTWAGFFFPTANIPFTAANTTITARVHSSKAGAPMVMKVEGPNGAESAEITAVPATVAGWQTLSWTFANLDLSKTYNTVVILPDFGTSGAGEVYHFDDITLVPNTDVPPPPAQAALPINFDDVVPTEIGQFGAGGAVTIAEGPTGGSGNAVRFTKTAGDTWAGFFFPTAEIPFTATSRTITARVHSTKAGAPMVMKIEGPGGVATAEIPATPATVVGWQTLRWHFPNLDLSKTYNTIVILPDSGNVGSGQVYHFDDIALAEDSVAPPPATNFFSLTADAISLLNGGSQVTYTLSQFESEAGINVSWPIPSPTLMRVGITEVGTAVLPENLKVSAAVSITEVAPGGKGEIQAFIDNVSLRKTATGLEVAVPATGANALVYSVSSDGHKKMVIDFGNGVAGVGHTLLTAAGASNNLVFGEVVQYAINQLSNDFSGIYGLRGKYRVTVVLTDVPLRRADGTALPTTTVVVPTQLNATGGVAASRTVTGVGITGYITLTN